jgi:hypothetical protein
MKNRLSNDSKANKKKKKKRKKERKVLTYTVEKGENHGDTGSSFCQPPSAKASRFSNVGELLYMRTTPSWMLQRNNAATNVTKTKQSNNFAEREKERSSTY